MFNEWTLLPAAALIAFLILNLWGRLRKKHQPTAPAESVADELMFHGATKPAKPLSQPSLTPAITPKIDAFPLIRLLFAGIFSIAISAVALYVVASGGQQHPGREWATAALGTVLGYWLNEKRG